VAKEERVKPGGKGVPAVGVIGGAAVLATLLLYFATRAKAAPSPPPPGLATLYGIVTDAETGQPISGVLVSLNGWTAYTRSGGYYAFTEIQPGAYTITFSKEGYQTAVY